MAEFFDREDFKRAIEKLKEIRAKKVFIQFGEGLKLRIQDIVKILEKEGFTTVTCLQECYGACDIRDFESKRLGCDTILHIGHEEFVPKSEIKLPVVYWEYFIDVDPLPVLKNKIEFTKLEPYKKIGLITSIQFVDTIEKVKRFLESHGKKVLTHKALQHPGQILGCNLDAATKIEKEVDCFLCISAGKFYGWGLMLKTEKPMFCLDLEKGEIIDMKNEKKKIQKIIAWNKSQFEDAKKIGILVSWKRGQVKLPFELKKKLEAKGKEVYIFAMDEITPEKLMGLKIDAAVSLACPRIGIDDLERYEIPILNLEHIEL